MKKNLHSVQFGFLVFFTLFQVLNANVNIGNSVLGTPDFGIRLNKTTKKIDIGYGDFNIDAVLRFGQLDLRGTTNLDYNTHTNFVLAPNKYWNRTISGQNNNVGSEANNIFSPKSDQLITWSAAACTVPTGLTLGARSSTFAEVVWIAPATAPVQYDVFYSTSAAAPNSNTTPTGSSTIAKFSKGGLTANTTYYIWVRSSCVADRSAWVGPLSFKTLEYPLTPYFSSFKVDSKCPTPGTGISTNSLFEGLGSIRYIKLTQKINEDLQIQEIEVYEIFKAGVKTKLTGPGGIDATASASPSYNSTYTPEKAIDGDTTSPSSMWHGVGNTAGQFLKVDLKASKIVDKLRIYNRIDCCWNRGREMLLELFDYNDKLVYAKTINLYEGVNAAHYIDVNIVDFAWTDGGTGLKRTLLSPGTYTLNYEDVIGNSATSVTTIGSVNPSPAIEQPTQSLLFCLNASSTKTVNTIGTTTGGTVSGLPVGLTATWNANKITFSRTPTVAGTFNYSIPLTGICGSVVATGTIIISNPVPTLPITSAVRDTSATVSWTAPVPNGGPTTINYTLEVYTNPTYTLPVTGSPFSVGTSVSKALAGLSPNTIYYYRIKGNNGCESTYIAGNFKTLAKVEITPNKVDQTCPTSNDGSVSPVLSGGLSNIRYIKLTQKTNNGDYPLQIREIEAYEIFTGTNVAKTPSAKATASSVLNNYQPLNAIDGDLTSGNFYHSAAGTSAGEWIKVDLQSGKNIDKLRLYNRADCCWQRGQNLLLELFDASNNLVYSKTVNLWEGINGAHYIDVNILDVSWLEKDQNNQDVITLNRTGLGAGTYTLQYADALSYTLSSPIIIGSTYATNTAGVASLLPIVCLNTSFTPVTHTTTGATGIGPATGLPAGITASWAANSITISGTPTASGTFNYSIPLTGGCGTVAATGTITVNPVPNQVTLEQTPIYSVGTTACDLDYVKLDAYVNAIVGTGNESMGSYNYPNPLSVYWGGAKHQMIYLASELLQQGMVNGSVINKVGLDIATYSAYTTKNLTIRMKNTSSEVLTVFETGTTTVYGGTDFTSTANGWTNFNLTTPFVWDGISNVIVEFVHNSGAGSVGPGSSVRCTDTGVKRTVWAIKNNVDGGVQGFDDLTSYNYYEADTKRPNIHFGFLADNLTWSPTVGLFNDSSLSSPYTGGLTFTLYAAPDASTVFTAKTSNGFCDETAMTNTIQILKQGFTGSDNEAPTLWNVAGNWTNNAVPTADKCVNIANTKNVVIDINNAVAKSINIEIGASLTINKDQSLTVTDAIINNAGENHLIIKNDGNLLQINDVAINTGKSTVQRNSKMKRLDYTYWASPVKDQNLLAFSLKTLPNRFVTYNEATDKFEAITPGNNIFGNRDDGVFESYAKGYAIRASNYQPNTVTDWEGQFKGVLNNGEITFPLKYQSGNGNVGNGYNLVGNPYASNIDFYDLHSDNATMIENTAYFWTNTNPNAPMQGSGYPEEGYYNNYAVLNGIGGVGATSTTEEDTLIPNEFIKVGQGFIVKAKKTGNLTFKNSIRSNNTTSIFFSKSGAAPDRYWLQLTTPLNVVTTQLIGYNANATNGFELDYDAPLMVLGSDAFYSVLDNEKLAIQGKAPFVQTDKVTLGTSHHEDGNYTISLGIYEGIFAAGQSIYLKDHQTDSITNLSEGNYTFTANKGLTDGRFEIMYQPEIVLGTGSSAKESLIVYRDGSDFVVKSTTKNISDIDVLDASGRLIITLKPNLKETRIDATHYVNGIYVLKIKTTLEKDQKGKVVTKKIMK